MKRRRVSLAVTILLSIAGPAFAQQADGAIYAPPDYYALTASGVREQLCRSRLRIDDHANVELPG